MWRKCKVVMLPTNEKSILFIGKASGQLHDLAIPDKDESTLNQNLYIFSDDKIKEGDWYLVVPEDSVRQAQIDFDGNHRDFAKIIASTDSSLGKYKEKIHTDELGISETDGIKFYNFPSIPKSFIERYVSEDNKGNKIEEVMVEYEAIPTAFDNPMTNPLGLDTNDSLYDLKINTDNTINIKSIKDSWTREEVNQLLIDCCGEIYSEDGTLKGKSPTELYKWIKSNL